MRLYRFPGQVPTITICSSGLFRLPEVIPGQGQFTYEIPVSGGAGSAQFHVDRVDPHSVQNGNLKAGSAATIVISVKCTTC
jgi:hypothetical protein